MQSNADPPAGVAKGLELGKSAEPYEEEGADECVKELSVRMSLENDEDEEYKKEVDTNE